MEWFSENEFLVSVPLAKFGAGCVCYLASVIFSSYADLELNSGARYFALIIGCMSVSMVFMTAGYLFTQRQSNSFWIEE